MTKLRVQDLILKDKRALVRVDFNVPLDEKGAVSDDTRIVESVPTIRTILDRGGSAILMSHLGRPKGRDPNYSLSCCKENLEGHLGIPVVMAKDCIGPEVERSASELKPGQVLLLENLRFYPAEEKPSLDPTFGKKLAALGDLYINDAFAAAHRAHSSITELPRYFPEASAAGLLLQKEIDFLSSAFMHPKHPFYALIGGAKVSTKLGVLKQLLQKVDGLFIGGAMAYTFLKALGIETGASPVEVELLEEAKNFFEMAKEKKIPVHLPIDIHIADSFSENAHHKFCLANEGIPKGWQGMDIGPKTIERWGSELLKAEMIFWNGPMGVFEMEPFAGGTDAIARLLSHLKGATTIVGGGDSVAAVKKGGYLDSFSHVSTGGGACLEYMEFGHLPGIDALTAR